MAEYGDTDTDDSGDESPQKDERIDDVDDDELELLASINAKYNSNNTSDNSLQSKGINLHRFSIPS